MWLIDRPLTRLLARSTTEVTLPLVLRVYHITLVWNTLWILLALVCGWSDVTLLIGQAALMTIAIGNLVPALIFGLFEPDHDQRLKMIILPMAVAIPPLGALIGDLLHF